MAMYIAVVSYLTIAIAMPWVVLIQLYVYTLHGSLISLIVFCVGRSKGTTVLYIANYHNVSSS